jgi:outer membrane protein
MASNDRLPKNKAMRHIMTYIYSSRLRGSVRAAVGLLGLSVLLILLVALPGGAQTAGSSAPTPLSLEEAVKIALKNNPTIQEADAYADVARHGIAVAKAGYLPQVNFAEGFTRGNNPVYVFGSLLTQRQFTAANFALPFLNVPPPLDNFRTAFTASAPLYDFGRTSRRVTGARLGARSSLEASHRIRQEVIFEVIKAYLNGLLAREHVQVAQAAVKMTQADLSRAHARQEQGLAVPSDVLSAQAQLAQAQEDLIEAQNAVEIAQASLNVAMGLPEDASPHIAGKLAEATFQSQNLSNLQATALKVRPDYLQVLLGIRQAENGVKSAHGEFLPRIDLLGSWETDNQTFASRGGNNWTAGAMLTFNIFNGGARRAEVAQSRARERQVEAMRSRMESVVRLQVREAYLNLNAAHQRVEVSRDAANQAQESLRILRNRYEAGLVTIMDVLKAETMRTSAQNNHLNALYDYRLAYAALELATGEIAPDSPAVTQ